MSLFTLHIHGFSLVTYVQHLFFDSLASVGGYYARGFCRHRWHRWLITVIVALTVTLLLVTLVG